MTHANWPPFEAFCFADWLLLGSSRNYLLGSIRMESPATVQNTTSLSVERRRLVAAAVTLGSASLLVTYPSGCEFWGRAL